jgi:hypothetical protein
MSEESQRLASELEEFQRQRLDEIRKRNTINFFPSEYDNNPNDGEKTVIPQQPKWNFIREVYFIREVLAVVWNFIKFVWAVVLWVFCWKKI